MDCKGRVKQQHEGSITSLRPLKHFIKVHGISLMPRNVSIQEHNISHKPRNDYLRVHNTSLKLQNALPQSHNIPPQTSKRLCTKSSTLHPNLETPLPHFRNTPTPKGRPHKDSPSFISSFAPLRTSAQRLPMRLRRPNADVLRCR